MTASKELPPPPGDDIFRLIGEYVFYFSRLEDVVRGTAGDLLRLSDDQRDRVMPVIDFAAACNICKAEIPQCYSGEAAEGALNLINRALKAAEDRNRIAHGSWLHIEGKAVAIHSSRTTLQQQVYFSNPGELARKIKELRQLAELIWETL